MKDKWRARGQKKEVQSRKLEHRLVVELEDKLAEYLEDNERVLFEISMSALSEFMNILNDKLLVMYDYEQVDRNKFVFYNKEITF